MKNWIALSGVVLLASMAWAFIPFGLGPTWNVNELDVIPPTVSDPQAPNLIIMGSQLSTGLDQPSVRSYDIYTEPASGGLAFEFQMGDGGDYFFNTETNSIFAVQNGLGGTGGWASDIYGNIGPLASTTTPGAPDVNRLLYDRHFNLTPTNGIFSVGAVPSLGWIEISDVVYSYSTDGTNGIGTVFDLVVDRGGSACSFELPCVAGSTTTAFIDETRFGTCILGGGFSQLTDSFVGTGNCAVVPTIRSLEIHHVFQLAPP